MRKGFFALFLLTVSLVLCSNAGFCQTTNYYYNFNTPPKTTSVIYNKQNTPYYTVRYNQPNYYSNYRRNNYPQYAYIYNQNFPPRQPKYNKKLAKKYYNNNYYSQYGRNYTRIGNNYKHQPSLLERIFNL